MIIRVGGGLGGISQYLKTGRKKGRTQGRDELDERIILIGDLDAMDETINTMAHGKEKYLHITLSFREDHVPTETLRSVAESFQKFVTAAYRSNELMCYAEAHIPRIKSLVSVKGKAENRFVHIHFVIPKLNLLTGKVANPLGLVTRQIPYLDAYQEWANAHYGLVSPKDNRRVHFEDGSDILARYKADVFAGANKAVKQSILNAILEQDIFSEVDLAKHLATLGEVKRRNEGRQDAYFNLKLVGDPKGINLKEVMFSQSFLELSKDEKKTMLHRNVVPDKFVTPGPRRDAGVERPKILNEWFSLRSREVKYLNSGNRSQWAEYQRLDELEKVKFLDKLEALYYSKTNNEQKLSSQDFVSVFSGPESSVEPQAGTLFLVHSDSSLGQRIRLEVDASLDATYMKKVSNDSGGFPFEKVQNELVTKFGMPTQKFDMPLKTAHSEGPLGLYLFLRRHMNQPPGKAWACLVRQGLVQPAQLTAPKQKVSDQLWKEFLCRKKKLAEIEDVAERRAALSVLQMSLVLSRKYLWSQSHEAFTRLQERADSELMTMSFSGPEVPVRPSEPVRALDLPEWSHRKTELGHVEYLRREKPVIRDESKQIVVKEFDLEVVEVGLRLAVLKYGHKIRVTGPDEFQRQAVLVAARLKTEVEFLNPDLQRELEKLRGVQAQRTGELSF